MTTTSTITDKEYEEFALTTMLVIVNIRSYSGRKLDKKVSRKAAKDHGADEDSGNYNKHLVSKDALEPVSKAVSALREFHETNSLPWLDEGIRVLPCEKYEDYRTGIEPLKDAFDMAVRGFCDKWPAHVESAKAQLGAMFNEADYPADIRDKFSCAVKFRPMPLSADFRANISESEKDLLREQMALDTAAGVDRAMGDLYARLGNAVKAMAERLRAYNVDPNTGKTTGVFRDSLVENLRELVELVPSMNFAKDAELEAIRKLCQAELCVADASELRADDATRDRVAESAESIMKRLGEFV